MKKVVLLALSVCFVQFAFAQKSFQPGYVVNTQGDTIKGFVDYRNWDLNPKSISFRKTETSEVEEFTPENSRAFAVADESYVAAQVPVVVDQDNEVAAPITNVMSVFLQVRMTGEKPLLYHKGKAEGFYIYVNNAYQLLEFKKYVRKIGDETKSAENKKFVGQLTLYFEECASMGPVLAKTKYNKKSLENTFSQYYLCTNATPVFKKEAEKVKFEFGALAGVSMTTLNFASNNASFNYLTKPSYPSSTNITAGLFIESVFPGNNGRWSINNELVYSSYSTEGEYGYTNILFVDVKQKTEIGNSQLKLNSVLRFKFPMNKFALYANAGIGNSVSIAKTNKRTNTTYGTPVTRSEEEALKDFKSYEFSWLAGIGARVGKYSLEIRHQRNFGGLTPASSLSSAALTNYVLIGYRF
jgi:hypothetical protein